MADGVSIAQRLDGQRILLTGATGFVGEALLHLLLGEVPGVHVTVAGAGQGVHLGRASGSARCSGSRSSPRWSRPAGGLDELMDTRVRVIEGDLAGPPALPHDLDAVVHCAGDVSFDPPVDEGFRTNVVGTRELLARVREVGPHVHYVHISTAYVAGRRRGSIPEGPVPHDADLEAELRWGLAQREVGRAPVPQRRRTRLRAQARREAARPGRPADRGRGHGGRAQGVGQGRAGADRHRAGAQPRLDRLLHLHQGAGRAGRGAARPRAPRVHRASEHHRVRPRAARTWAGSRASRWPSR